MWSTPYIIEKLMIGNLTKSCLMLRSSSENEVFQNTSYLGLPKTECHTPTLTPIKGNGKASRASLSKKLLASCGTKLNITTYMLVSKSNYLKKNYLYTMYNVDINVLKRGSDFLPIRARGRSQRHGHPHQSVFHSKTAFWWPQWIFAEFVDCFQGTNRAESSKL